MTAPAAPMRERDVAGRLAAAGCASPDWDARLLVDHAAATGLPLDDLVRRRAAREPLQHVLGVAWFRHLTLAVGPGVFLPRPETELVAGAALDAVRHRHHAVVVDLCAGSGAVGLAIGTERGAAGHSTDVHLVEADPDAAGWLRRNAAMTSGAQVVVHEADLADAPVGLDGAVDVVASNPPYLPVGIAAELDVETALHDPPLALWGGEDGLVVVRRVVERAAVLLHGGGTLVVEHDTTHDLQPLLASGWTDVRRHDDLTGRPRFTTAVRA